MTVATVPTFRSNAEVVRWAFEALNRHDLPALRQVWDEQTLERFPDRTCRGADEIAAYFAERFAAMPDMKMEIVAIAEQGDDVFVRWRLTGTHAGPLTGVEPTGRRIETDGIDHFVIRDGRVVSNFVVYDQFQGARQIGMLPPDGSPADRAMKTAFNARNRLARRLKR